MENRFDNRITNNKGNWDFLSHNSEKKNKIKKWIWIMRYKRIIEKKVN